MGPKTLKRFGGQNKIDRLNRLKSDYTDPKITKKKRNCKNFQQICHFPRGGQLVLTRPRITLTSIYKIMLYESNPIQKYIKSSQIMN